MSDSQQHGDRAPTGNEKTENFYASVDVAEAARRLGVTPDAIRSRLHRGTLEGEKVDGQWRVRLPAGQSVQRERFEPTGTQQDTDRQATGQDPDRQDAGDSTDRARQDAPTVDIAPLVEMIERLSRRNEELSAAAGMWQARAMHLEEQVKQLTPTVDRVGGDADDVVSGPERDETDDQDIEEAREPEASPVGVWARFRRWWAGG